MNIKRKIFALKLNKEDSDYLWSLREYGYKYLLIGKMWDRGDIGDLPSYSPNWEEQYIVRSAYKTEKTAIKNSTGNYHSLKFFNYVGIRHFLRVRAGHGIWDNVKEGE